MPDDLLIRNKNINRGFRKLEIWNLAIELYCFVHQVVEKYPKVRFKIKEQLEDSSFSIHSNIAEGYSRRTLKETLRFYEYSLSSSAECFSQMYALFVSNQISKEEFDCFDSKSYEIENKLLKMNKDLIERLKSDGEWRTDY